MAKTYSQAQKDQALALAAEHGLAEASRRMGFPRDTIKAWQRRGAGSTELTEPEAPNLRGVGPGKENIDYWQERFELLMVEAARLTSLGEHRSAKECTVQAGIATEKIELLRNGPKRSAAGGAPSDRKRETLKQIMRMWQMELRHKYETMTLDEIDQFIGQLKLERKARQAGEPSTFANPDDDEDVISMVMAIDLAERRRVDPLALPRARDLSPDQKRRARRAMEDQERAEGSAPERPAARVREPVAVVVRDIPLEPLDDDEPVEAEIVVPPVPRRRALPAAGASEFPAGSVQARLAGFWGANGDRR